MTNVIIVLSLRKRLRLQKMSASAAKTAVNWTALLSKLSPETGAAVSAFRRKQVDLQKQLLELQAQDAKIDFSRYRNTIKHATVVDNAEKTMNSFKPASYDLSEQLSLIEKHRQHAVRFYNI